MTTQTKDINMISGGVRSYVNVSQYDVGSEINFALYNNSSAFTPPAGTTVRVEGRKPDGNGFSYSASLSDNVVTVTVTDQMTVLSGEVLCELRLTKDSVDIGTANFILAVEEAPINSDIPISDTEIPAIIELARQEQYTAEAWAKGTRNGEPVSSSDPTYHNNSKYWANQAKKFIVEATQELTDTTGQFETLTGGKLESCIVDLNVKQDLHGYNKPWIGGSGKNKEPITVSGIKSANTSGTWNGNVYTINGMTFTILTDSDNNVIGIKIKNTPSATSGLILNFMSTALENGVSYILTGCPSGGSSSTYSISAGSMGSDIGGGRTFTYDSSASDKRNILFVGTNYNGDELIFYPMIRLASETDATFEPYTNICGISGHTQVEVTVSDEDETVVEDVTVNLGGTYYSGTLDVVSGKLTVDRIGVDFGSLTWESVSTAQTGKNRFRTLVADNKTYTSSELADIKSSVYYKKTSDEIYNCNEGIGISGNYIVVYDSSLYGETAQNFKTARTGQTIVYPLATPLTIQLTPQQINTIIGENKINAPLTGQSYASAIYRKMFAWSDVMDVINALS